MFQGPTDNKFIRKKSAKNRTRMGRSTGPQSVHSNRPIQWTTTSYYVRKRANPVDHNPLLRPATDQSCGPQPPTVHGNIPIQWTTTPYCVRQRTNPVDHNPQTVSGNGPIQWTTTPYCPWQHTNPVDHNPLLSMATYQSSGPQPPTVSGNEPIQWTTTPYCVRQQANPVDHNPLLCPAMQPRPISATRKVAWKHRPYK